MSILEVQNLSKIYGEKETKTVAVDNISFKVEKGEFVAIVGASGSGKSTLLHMIGGVDKPTSGNIIINGTNIYELSEPKQAEFRRRDVALIYQFYNLIPVLNVEENMCLPIKLDDKKVDTQKLNELIEKLGLADRRKNLPNELSGGQQQRVAIGRSLLQEPVILLADEPTGNLDPETAWDIMNLLNDINLRGTTVVVATHAKDIVDQMRKRVIQIDRGNIIRDDRKGGYEGEI